ncbi:MAG: hypothetical protein FJ202_01125 [Gemmatimonadetes bacterium]|nr:hypothetical protein [Gemmatimonadota bacterium]
MSRGRKNQLTGQIAEHLVVAELGRMGLPATGFSGNIPTFDVLATDEYCRTVPIQVKASTADNWPSDARQWMDIGLDEATSRQEMKGPSQLGTPDLIYVCVAIAPQGGEQRDRFFVLTMRELQHLCIAGYSDWMQPKNWRRPRNPASFDCRYSIDQLLPFENRWSLIRERFESSAPNPALA